MSRLTLRQAGRHTHFDLQLLLCSWIGRLNARRGIRLAVRAGRRARR